MLFMWVIVKDRFSVQIDRETRSFGVFLAIGTKKLLKKPVKLLLTYNAYCETTLIIKSSQNGQYHLSIISSDIFEPWHDNNEQLNI